MDRDPFSADYLSDAADDLGMPPTPKSLYAEGRLEEARRLLLEEAAVKPVQRLLQVDGFRAEADSIMHPDGDGNCLVVGETYELRKNGGHIPVRVHIHEEAEKGEVLALLRKITAWLEEDFDLLHGHATGKEPTMRPPDDPPPLRRIK